MDIKMFYTNFFLCIILIWFGQCSYVQGGYVSQTLCGSLLSAFPFDYGPIQVDNNMDPLLNANNQKLLY
ncbi:hypothetical protein DERF_009539 [Dermatophagoides farinae]|uniref:Uncharacterized protein n=1 Tax=Dermatophagoides farinae TaxID=6954 RepID=A0A922L1L7_DERFA|nr:hypothetical protein DERF_009539 [Dermatophagoides farinae]